MKWVKNLGLESELTFGHTQEFVQELSAPYLIISSLILITSLLLCNIQPLFAQNYYVQAEA